MLEQPDTLLAEPADHLVGAGSLDLARALSRDGTLLAAGVAVAVGDDASVELIELAVPGEPAGRRQRLLRQLAVVAELRDDVTREHTDRVGRSAALIAAACGIEPHRVRLIATAASLHDIGKIAIPERILLKPGRLDPRERAIMQRHAEIGAALLSASEVPELRLGEVVALSHHERWDGGGYPHGLAGEAIPLAARIAAIADVFDALVHERPYKPAWSLEQALAEILRQRGRQFDPELVDLFMTLDHRRLFGAGRSQAANTRRRALAAALAAAA
jgi:response regulator RpfG family c-di-GMP phosphodiesterase